MGPRSFWIQITGQKMCYTPTKTLVCATSYVLLCFHQNSQLRLQSHQNPILGPITHGFVSGLGLGSQDMMKLTSEKVLYIFIIINFH